jgi:hypothetical protein
MYNLGFVLEGSDTELSRQWYQKAAASAMPGP